MRAQASRITRGAGLTCALAFVLGCFELGCGSASNAQPLSQAGEIVPPGFGSFAGGDGVRPGNFRLAKQQAFGDRWPLVAAEAYVGCVLGDGEGTLVIVVDGVPWALSGAAKERLRARPFKLDISGAAKDIQVASGPAPWQLLDKELGNVPKTMTPIVEVARRMGCLSNGQGADIE